MDDLGRGGCLQQRLHDFICEKIEPYHENYAFFHRMKRRHFDEMTSSSVEGNNNGLKNSAAGVKPTQTLEAAVKTILFQDSTKNVLHTQDIGKDKTSS